MSEKKVIDYCVESGKNTTELAYNVEEKLKNGWELYYGPFELEDYVCQAMISRGK